MTDQLPIKTIAVCGIGQMGSAAAVFFRRAGYQVLLWGRNRAKLDAVGAELDRLEAWLDENVGLAPASGGAITPSDDLAEVDRRADLVMDCIAEDLEQKAALLGRMTSSIARGAVMISTTSGLSITQMGRRSGTAHLLVGAHFWNPPHLMPLVEVVRGADTPKEKFELVCKLLESIGKIAVRVEKDVPGFIGNRLQHAMWREAIALVEQGVATAEDVDRVARLTFGLRLPAVGPIENCDLVGLDLVSAIHSYLMPDLASGSQVAAAVTERVAAGQLGMKSGRGFYNWNERDAKGLVDRRDRQIVQQLRFLKECDAM
jgi:3-hydroxybutyryl-CoA dehydrogenase